MARISVIEKFVEQNVSDAFEWIIGDQQDIAGTVETDADPAVPEDLTGQTIEITLRFYKASVDRASTDALPKISKFRRDEDRPDRVIPAVIDPDQVANTGKFTWRVPADLYADPQPEVDATANVPVIVGFRKKTNGADIRQSRFLMVLRAGA